MNPAAEGTTYPDMPFVVTPERVAGFREVFGQSSGVPPTILTAAEFTVLPAIVADPGWTSISRAWCTDRRSTPSPGLRGRASGSRQGRLESVRVRAGTGFVTITIDLVDEAGGHVCTAGRPWSNGRRLMRPFEDVAVGDELPALPVW